MSDKKDQEKFVKELCDQLGLEPSEANGYAPKRIRMLRNQLWQGQAAKKRFPLGVVFAKSPEDVEIATNHARRRMTPDPNGFDAVVICERNAKNRWTFTRVVEREGKDVALRLKQLIPDIQVITAKPAFRDVSLPVVGRSTSELVSEVVRQLQDSLNVILQGPPGSGKTFIALEAAKELAGAEPDKYQLSALLESANGSIDGLVAKPFFRELPLVWEIVQLHPGYTYDDFVRGRTLVADGTGSRFESVDKIVPQLAKVAKERPGKPTLLIVDELNRCNLANVLGELIFAIEKDKRGEGVKLQYAPPSSAKPGEGGLLSLPRELYILGTMNTADRSIALVDYAIRRRFRFVDVFPDPRVIAEYYAGHDVAANRISNFLSSVNALIRDDRLHVGHSYFLVPPESQDWARRLANRIAYEVIPLLREYLAEGHLIGSSLTLPDGKTIAIQEGGIDLGDTNIRDLVEDALTG